MGQPLVISAETGALAGRDLAALALMPVTVAAPAKTLDPWEYSYQIVVDGKVRRFDVKLQPGTAGWPTHDDQMVYLALLQLSVQAGERNRLACQRHEVFELLNWNHGGGVYYDRFRGALERLTSLTVFVRSAMVSRNGREYSQTTEGAHLVDSFRISNGTPATVTVEWGRLVREAMALEDLKRLDWGLLQSLSNPLTVQLYRLLDRVTLAGQREWEVGWRPLATALGINPESYSRPARFRQVLDPHLNRLMDQGVLDSVDYQAGGKFVFHVRNYLRAELRRVLLELGVYAEAARQLLAGHDEALIMAQCDCLNFRRPRPESPAGYVTKAIREGYELRYPDDEPEAFAALWAMLGEAEQHQVHRAALKVCGVGEDLFATRPDPTAWPVEMRAVARFVVSHSLDPAQV